MSSALLVALLPFSSYVVVLPFLKDEWGLGNAEAATAFSSYLLGLAVASLVVVPLTERLAPERVLVIGCGVLVLSNLAFAYWAHDFWSAAGLRVLAGSGHVATYFPGIRLVAERFADARRGVAVSIFVGSGYLGTTLSYVLTGELVARTDSWQQAYAATAAISLPSVVAFFVLCRTRGVPLGRSTGVLELGVVRERSLLLLNLAYALHSAELYLARLWLPLLLGALLVRHGESPAIATASAAVLAGWMFTTGVAGVFIGGFLSDRLGRTATAGILFAVSGACSFVLGWLLEWPPAFMIAVGFVYGFTTAADASIYSTAVTEIARPGTLGSAQAIQSFTGFLTGAIAPVAGGMLLDLGAGWGWTFAFNGVLAVGGVAALLRLRRDPAARDMALGKR